MSTEPSEHDPLEAWLRQYPTAPVPDDGFTFRVMSALPVLRPAPVAWRSWALASAGAAAGLAFVLLWSGGAPDFGASAASLQDLATSGLDLLVQPSLGLMLVFAALVLYLALDADEGAAE